VTIIQQPSRQHPRVQPPHLPPEQRLLLHNVRWQTYEMLLADLHDRPIRLTYDRGDLEFMAPSFRHEVYAGLLGRFIATLAEELEIPFKSGRTTTFRRQDMARGLEPDDCFYIRSLPLILGKEEIDLSRDPPPDLGIEVDITRSSLNRMGIYAALRVPEVWRFDGQTLQVHQLRPDGTYEEGGVSQSFPTVPLPELVGFLHQATTMDDLALMRSFRAWVRSRIVQPRQPPPPAPPPPGV
jgi:Uma2 family endonuclease